MQFAVLYTQTNVASYGVMQRTRRLFNVGACLSISYNCNHNRVSHITLPTTRKSPIPLYFPPSTERTPCWILGVRARAKRASDASVRSTNVEARERSE